MKCQALDYRKMEKAWLVEIFSHFQIFGAFRKLLKVPFSFFIKFSKLIVCVFCNSALRTTNCRITFVFEDCFSFSFYPLGKRDHSRVTVT